uniref:Uncharacterized protein n=1 Tax=Cliftonaea pectinata TaxID=2007206 RepID=A0A1Z1MQ16_9FLOR|nr:hypothetical protein [Cliftonaea pectinata]ARW68170.1 hypothetical protein [Cliftonaea pectinata]
MFRNFTLIFIGNFYFLSLVTFYTIYLIHNFYGLLNFLWVITILYNQ